MKVSQQAARRRQAKLERREDLIADDDKMAKLVHGTHAKITGLRNYTGTARHYMK